MFQARDGGWLGLALAVAGWMLLAPTGVVAQDGPAPVEDPVLAGEAAGQELPPWTQTSLARALADVELLLTVDRAVDSAAAWMESARLDEEIEALLAADAGLRVEFERIAGLVERANKPDQSGLREQLRLSLVNRGASKLIDQLGDRAIAPLEQLVDEIVAPDPGTDEDPLWWLFKLDPVRTVEFVARREAEGRPLDPYRVMRAFARAADLKELFLPVPFRAPRLRVPEFPALWARYLRDPRWEQGSLDDIRHLDQIDDQITYLAERSALTDELREAVVDVIRRRAPLSRHLDRLLTNTGPLADLLPVFEALVDIDDATLRRSVFARLGDLPVSDALLSGVDDADSEVRWHVARALGRHQVIGAGWDQAGSRTGGAWDWYSPMRGEREIAALVRLARDPDASVRKQAVLSIGDGRAEAMPIDVLVGLARDADAGVREELALSIQLPHEALAQVLLALCDSEDEHVLHAVDVRLESADWKEGAESLLPVLLRRRADPTLPLGFLLGASPGSKLIRNMATSPEGRRELARWTAETGNVGWLDTARQARGARGLDAWFALDAEILERVVPLLAELSEADFQVFCELAERRDTRSVEPWVESWLAASARLAPRRDLPPMVRLMAARALASVGGVGSEDALVAVLSEPGLDRSDEMLMQWIRTVGAVPPLADRDRLRLRLLAEARVDEGLLQDILADSSRADAPFSPEVSAQVLDRWFDRAVPMSRPVAIAMHRVPEIPAGRVDPSLLIEAAHMPSYALAAVRGMGKLRDPLYLPALGECLDPDWIPESVGPRSIAEAAAESLASYLSDEAAAILLDGAARTTDAQLRDTFLAGVGVIAAYQDSVANWERRVSVRALREDAVRELGAMLDDVAWEVRLQAVRGLGTLRAAESIPELIRRLRDDDARVRDAAIEALDKINSAEEETVTTEGGVDVGG